VYRPADADAVKAPSRTGDRVRPPGLLPFAFAGSFALLTEIIEEFHCPRCARARSAHRCRASSV
jgi:hypothetical protein